MFLDKQNELFCFVVWRNEYDLMIQLAQPYMTFDLTLWLANGNRSRGIFPKIRSGGNLRGVPREQKLGRFRVRR
jgi:hypothetical protein